jgi:hypothetical protein
MFESASLLFYGLHKALLFVDGVAVRAFRPSHDPIPTAASSMLPRQPQPGDPFLEVSRPLVLTLSYEWRESPSKLKDLLSLSTLPGVVVVVANGVPTMGYDVEVMSWSVDGSIIRAEIQPQTSEGADLARMRAHFDGPSVVRSAELHRSATAQLMGGGTQDADRALGVPQDQAALALYEGQAHEALGYDYIVSPTLVRARRHPRKAWFNQLGACSFREAMALAGAKARLYRSIPLVMEPHSQFMINTGLWLEMAVQHFVPTLQSAIKASLAPSASPEEAATAPHLLAIRSRLTDYLIARDALFRLGRSEALGPLWVRPFDSRPAAGAGGNDRIALQMFHFTAALEAAFSVLDNLAWTFAKRDGNSDETYGVGFNALVAARRQGAPAWLRGSDVLTAARAISASASVAAVLGARQVRNAVVHSDGIHFGAIDWHPAFDAPIDGLSGFWLSKSLLRDTNLVDGSTACTFDAIRAAVEFDGGDMAAGTFFKFVTELWFDLVTVVSDAVRAVEWPSGASWRPSARLDGPVPHMHWKQGFQRLLWGL